MQQKNSQEHAVFKFLSPVTLFIALLSMYGLRSYCLWVRLELGGVMAQLDAPMTIPFKFFLNLSGFVDPLLIAISIILTTVYFRISKFKSFMSNTIAIAIVICLGLSLSLTVFLQNRHIMEMLN